MEYLKSDTYLYAPLEGTQGRDDFAIKKIISPQRGTVPFGILILLCVSQSFHFESSLELNFYTESTLYSFLIKLKYLIRKKYRYINVK